MRLLVLVKHAAPHIDPAIPASAWELAAVGRTACIPLAAELAPYAPRVVVASVEPKAAETGRLVAARLDVPFETAADLHEHDRRDVPFTAPAQFHADVARFFAQPADLVHGRETADAAHARFAAAVAGVLARHPTGNVAVVAHGTVISLYVARAAGLAPLALWERLDLPSFVVLGLPGPRVVAIVERVTGE